MMDPQLVLHVGAPKCGSSALQTALSRTPDLGAGRGRKFRYVTAVFPDKTLLPSPVLRYGAALRRDGIRSRFGYASFPDFPNPTPKVALQALELVLKNGRSGGHVPILSNEGWIMRHATFADLLARLGHPPVEVVAFLRPPLEWLNASFWQWGIWSTPNLTAWMDRAKLTYSFGLDLEAWSRIPNVRIRVRPSKPDIVGHFAALYDLPLQAGPSSNVSSPPVLIGFLLRNRRLRPGAHDPQTEFIFQRWCPRVEVRSPWAAGATHVHRFRPTVARNVEALRRILPEQDCDLLFAEPRWQSEKPYHAELLAGVTPLDTLAELPLLLQSLQHGLAKAAMVAGKSPPPAIPPLPPGAGLADWDEALAATMDQLLQFDRLAREKMAGNANFYNLLEQVRKWRA